MHISTLKNIDFKRQNWIASHVQRAVFILSTDTLDVLPLMGMARVQARTGISQNIRETKCLGFSWSWFSSSKAKSHPQKMTCGTNMNANAAIMDYPVTCMIVLAVIYKWPSGIQLRNLTFPLVWQQSVTFCGCFSRNVMDTSSLRGFKKSEGYLKASVEGSVRWLSGQKSLDTSAQTLILWLTEFDPRKSVWGKKRTDSCKLSSDLHKHTMACGPHRK